MKKMGVHVLMWVLVLGLMAAFQAAAVRADGSPFKGRWKGNYTAKIGNGVQKGTVSLTVYDNGTFEGAWENKTHKFTWETAGTIDNDGNMTGEILKPNRSELKGTTKIEGHVTEMMLREHKASDRLFLGCENRKEHLSEVWQWPHQKEWHNSSRQATLSL